MLRAVLFDVDGTVLDTFEFIYRAFELTLEAHGYPVHPRIVLNQTMGGPLTECYRTLAPGCDSAELAESHRRFQVQNIPLARPFPASHAVLGMLKESGLLLAAVTTRSNRSSVRTMESAGIAEYFEVILSAEDVQNHKPHPEPLERAMAALAVAPEECVMVGDTYADIEAGRNAGVLTIGATYGFGGERLLAARPDYLMNDLEELPAILRAITDGDLPARNKTPRK